MEKQLSDNIKPEVGIGATLVLHSDRQAHTISRVSKTGKTFWMKRDIVECLNKDGIFGQQFWKITENPKAGERSVRLCKGNVWRHYGSLVGVGYKSEYYDPTF